MAWLYNKRNHSSNGAADTPRIEVPIAEIRPPEPEQQQSESPGSWMYRRVRAVFEASHRAPDREDVLIGGSGAAGERVMDQHEDENDSNQQEEETHSDMTDESLDVPDARQLSSDSETSNAPSDTTRNADIASASTRATVDLKISEISSNSRQDENNRVGLEVKQPPQGDRGTPNKQCIPNETKERKSTIAKAIHDDLSAFQKSESRATSGNMMHISQNNSLRNGIDGKLGRLSTRKETAEEFQSTPKFQNGKPASDVNSAVGRLQYVETRAVVSTPIKASSRNETTGRYFASKIDSSPLPKFSTVFLKKLPEPTLTSPCQKYIPDGDKKPVAIPRPTERDMEILESNLNGKRKRSPETHTGSRPHLSWGLPLQIEFKSSDLSHPESTGQASLRDPSSFATNADILMKLADIKKKKRRHPLIYKTCRDKFPKAKLEKLQRTIPPKDESYFCTRKKRTLQIAILSKESAMMMDQLGFGIPKDCDPNMLDIRKMIGEAVRGVLYPTAKWEFFIPDSGAYIKRELESMISLHDYLDECGLGEHISVRIVSENGPAVFQLNRTPQQDDRSPGVELLIVPSRAEESTTKLDIE
eukprot:scaffold4003_cov165-Amphora_coffeaeformis.AAC.6